MSWPREFTPKVRALIETRSGGVCECCGIARGTQVHHRLYKSRRGVGNPANGLHVCSGTVGGNVDGCHGVAHAGYIGESLGWAIRSSRFEPFEYPVFRKADRSWWLLDDEGGKVQIPAPDALELLEVMGVIREGMPT